MVSSSSSASHEYDGPCLEDHCRSLRVVEVVEDVGLMTCGRMAYSLCEGAAVISLGVVDIGSEELGRVQVE